MGQAPARSHKPIIGLLGAPGSGKSAVARHFETLGCAVIDADALAHQALAEPEVRDQIVAGLGPDVLDDAGRIDRKTLGQRVFDDPDALKRLESIVHPRVHAARAARRAELAHDPAVKAIVEDTPLLLEAGLDRECDVLVYVDAPRHVRLQRLHQTRGWDEQELARREKKQASLDTKRSRADHVIDNSASQARAHAQVSRVLSLIFHEREQA